MVDIYTKAERSVVMSRVRSRGNKCTEVALAHLLRAHRVSGWRRHQKLPGTPDFSFRKYRLAIFVDGCFWHGCPQHGSFPATRRAFWLKKLATNKARDRRVRHEMRKRGWRTLRLWEHELKQPERCLRRVLAALGIKRGQTAHPDQPQIGYPPSQGR